MFAHVSIILVPLIPLWAGLILGLAGSRMGEENAYRLGIISQVLPFIISLPAFYEIGHQGPLYLNIPLVIGHLQTGLYVDRLSAVMMVLITGISTLIHLFSRRYMQQERGFARFYALLGLTSAVLLFMVTSRNLLMLFIFWQLLSWLLYLLLAYNYSRLPTIRVAFKTFITLRLGDVALLSAIVLAYGLYGTLDFPQLFVRAANVPATFSLWPGARFSVSAVTVIALLIFVGAMSKSAQFPLHRWLPDSMYTPTPVSALMHAGLVNAGGFLLNRLAPLYGLSPTTLHVVFVVGALTAFLGASMMLTQNDIKKTLGYSTMAQMGYMIMECGLGAFALAIFHLIAHGLFKATLFLYSGSGIHEARREPRFPPRHEAIETGEFSRLAWFTGFFAFLILPLVILLASHGILNIPLRDSQGAVILLFFAWVASSQAILSLYRLQAISSWKVAGAMMGTLIVVVLTYLWAAESFTYFLYPASGEAAYYYQTSALPGWLFDLMVGVTALLIILGWIFIYAKAHGQSILMPGWVNLLQIRLYLLFVNRLYLDHLWFRLGRVFTSMAHRLDQSRVVSYGTGLFAVVLALSAVNRLVEFSLAEVVLLIAVALFLPLFPLHGVYLAALTRLPGSISKWFAFLLPLLGFFGLIFLLPRLAGMPREVFTVIRVLALFGAVYGSIMALAQSRMSHLLAYTSLAFYSIFWWHVSMTGKYTPQGGAYASAAALVIGGLFLAWNRVQARYGDPDLNQIGGLAYSMPRLTILFSLLVMAAVGLPPFGLFSSYLAMLLDPPLAFSMDIVIILMAWFSASWYLFRMMQRVLFGPHRSDIPYHDLLLTEAAPLLIVLCLMLGIGVMGIVPYEFFGPERLTLAYQIVMDMTSWDK